MNESDIDYRISPAVTNDELNRLFASAWEKHTTFDFAPAIEHCLLYVCAYDAARLVGYVNVAWDGAQHAFILDTTVDREYQRRGIGTELVKRAAAEAKKYRLDWLHVDYDEHLEDFYRKCGFQHTPAGLINLRD